MPQVSRPSCDNAPRFFATVSGSEVAVSKHADLANRIFRTVVFSGAMLGTAVAPALAQQPNPPAQGAPAPKAPPAKADTWVSVNKEIEATDKKLDAAVVKLVAAHKAAVAKKDAPAPDAALLSAVADLRTARTDLDGRLAKTTRDPFVNEKAAPDVEKTETALAEADTKLFAAVDALNNAKEIADRKTAITGAETARKARVAAAAKVKAARTKAAKRPRAVAEYAAALPEYRRIHKPHVLLHYPASGYVPDPVGDGRSFRHAAAEYRLHPILPVQTALWLRPRKFLFRH
jgi:hypothetical protein